MILRLVEGKSERRRPSNQLEETPVHKKEDHHFAIYDEHSTLPEDLPALTSLFRQAQHAKVRVLAVSCSADEDTKRAVAKRRHDLTAALRTLGFTVKALQTGYTFQDDVAAAKIDAIAKAVQIVEREAGCLNQLLLGEGQT
jgi:hypothetical protein